MTSPYNHGFHMEGPFIPSRGEYIQASGSRAIPSLWAELNGGTESATNKLEVERYSGTDGIQRVQGMYRQTIYESGYAYDNLYGNARAPRDTDLMEYGIFDIVYVSGATQPLPANKPLAPHASGVIEWTPGMFCIGTSATYLHTGVKGKVLVDLFRGQPAMVYHNETITLTSNTGSFTYPPYMVESIVSGEAAWTPFVSGTATTSTGMAAIKYGGTTDAIAIDSPTGGSITHLKVRYWRMI